MNDEQINEVMRLGDEIADYAWKQGLSDGAYSQADHDRKSCDASRAALEAYLRTIGEPAGYSLPAGSIGAKKFAQVGGGFTPVGLVFSRGESAMAITEHGRVYWDRDLVHPISGEPESVNAELLEALKDARHCIGIDRDTLVDCHTNPCTGYLDPDGALAKAEYDDVIDAADAAIARAESAIESSPVPAGLLQSAKSVLKNLEKLHAHPADEDGFRGWQNGFGESVGDALQDSIEALKLAVSAKADTSIGDALNDPRLQEIFGAAIEGGKKGGA